MVRYTGWDSRPGAFPGNPRGDSLGFKLASSQRGTAGADGRADGLKARAVVLVGEIRVRLRLIRELALSREVDQGEADQSI